MSNPMTVDLSKFVGQKVRVTFASLSDKNPWFGQYFTVGVNYTTLSDHYPYVLTDQNGKVVTSYTREGHRYKSFIDSLDIVDIQPFTPTMNNTIHEFKVSFSNLGQAWPNIDLSKFVGEEVYVKVTEAQQGGGSFSDRQMIGRVKLHTSELDASYVIQGNFYARNGARQCARFGRIEAIYPTDAFTVLTADVEPAPEPQEVIQAKEALKKLTPEQLKQLIDKITEAGE
jgi:hypothetical protein